MTSMKVDHILATKTPAELQILRDLDGNSEIMRGARLNPAGGENLFNRKQGSIATAFHYHLLIVQI